MSTTGSQDLVPDLPHDSKPSNNGGGLPSSSARSGSAPATVQEAWELVLNHVVALTQASGGAIALLQQDVFVCKATVGEAPLVLILENCGEGLVAECIRTGRVVVCGDVLHDPRVEPRISQLLDVGSLVILPLHVGSNVEGLIALSSIGPFAFDEPAVDTMRAIAAAIELIVFIPAEESLAAAPESAIEPPVEAASSSGALASAFARAMADSSAAAANSVQHPVSDVNDFDIPAAELFAAAGVLRADLPGAAIDDRQPPNPLSSPAPDVAAATAVAPVANVAPDAPVVQHPEPSVGRRAPQIEPSTAATISPTIRDKAAEPHSSRISPSLARRPDSGALDSKSRGWLVAFVVLLLVAFGSVSVWLLRQSHANHPNPALQLEQSRTVETPPAPESINALPAQTTAPAPDHTTTAAAAAPTSAKPDRVSMTPPSSSKPSQNPMVLPAPRPAEFPADETVIAPPVPPPSASHAASTLKSLLSGTSELPVLSDRIDASSVTLPVPRDPQSVFSAARLITQILPSYPDAARNANRQGSVVLRATVAASGRVTQVSVVSGDPTLTSAAVSAVRSWVYQPATIDGRSVDSTVQVTLNFHLRR